MTGCLVGDGVRRAAVVIFHSVVVGVVPFAVQGCFDDDEDGECDQDDAFQQVDTEVPALRTLPAGVAGLEEGHCGV